ncbi:helix-turn-helix transcriptional regulator [Zeaxanthinibacter sp. PT1]|uniref:helix-turn-helix transcriptional regulator n=1 Tax=Zeaxanthinibacter TaxID=561554 RepID=UPI00234A5808|nr:helix-turn-helix transcriptional regulator [Zeaxanthinibacter sp. PT1]MDC6350204.1 helix-turn-helix transcriptional regulator [Zeaxanthinibacter sp. PT1]
MQNSLKVERARLKMTQADLAVRVGVSRQTINAIELGKYGPSTVLALRLSGVFGKTVNELFSLEDDDLN